MASKLYNFRLSPEVNSHLDSLSSLTGMSRTGIVVSLIEAEYDKYQGNPELRRMMTTMLELKAQMESMMGRNDVPNTLSAPKESECE